jgi:DNA-binding beta-propeller fold protein YncE
MPTVYRTSLLFLAVYAMGVWLPLAAQERPLFEVDPFWPGPLPTGWINATLGHPCIDSHDHIAVLDRQNIRGEEAETSVPAASIMLFDTAGTLVNSWGDSSRVPDSIHGCAVDADNNIWVVGNNDGIAQKYTHEGELLFQIGTKGVLDTSDGTAIRAADNSINREPLNAGHDRFFYPAGVAVDPDNGDAYIADGYGNKRIAVFDKDGRFLRQWGRQATLEETRAGAGGAFTYALHCVAISNAGLVYVCDREGLRVQVFDKQGNFIRNIWVKTGNASLPDTRGTVWGLAFSRDESERHLYVLDGRHEQVHVLDHASGEILSSFGRPGHQLGNFTVAHGLAIDSQGNLYVAESGSGRRVQRFKPAPNE